MTWFSVAQIVFVVGVGSLAGRLAKRLGQPEVLGELLAGLAVGAWAVFRPEDPLFVEAARAGLILLLFRTGLDTDKRELLRAGPAALAVALTGVALPFLLGAAVTLAAGRSPLEAVFIGGALTATSVGITVRVLSDLGRMGRAETHIVLGAAVIDDVLGLLVLAAVAGAAHAASSGFIVAAFLAGLAINGRAPRPLRAAVDGAAWALIPVFFVACGAAVRLSALAGGTTLALTAALIVAALLGKGLCGWAARGEGLNRWAIGAAMIPRGEVGLVFAQIGAVSGVLDGATYSSLVVVVAFTTFLAPLLIKRAFR